MNRTHTWLAALVIAALVACTNEFAVPTEPLRLLRPELGIAYVGEPFEGSLRPTGGLRPYRFEVVDGTLPPGLRLEGGRLVGTATEVGRFTFMAQVQDGNLSQAVLRVDVDVRALPTPVVRIDVPATEIRGELPLIVRVEDARGWRGARIALTWDPAAFELVAGPSPGDTRLTVFHEASEGRLQLDVAALGAARQGAFALARFSLRPLEEPARLSLDLRASSRYAGGDHVGERQEGAPRPAARALPGAPGPESGGSSGAEGATDPPSDAPVDPDRPPTEGTDDPPNDGEDPAEDGRDDPREDTTEAEEEGA